MRTTVPPVPLAQTTPLPGALTPRNRAVTPVSMLCRGVADAAGGGEEAMAGAGPEISRGHRTTIAASVAIVLSAVPPFFTGALMPIMRRDLDIGTDRLGIIVAGFFKLHDIKHSNPP